MNQILYVNTKKHTLLYFIFFVFLSLFFIFLVFYLCIHLFLLNKKENNVHNIDKSFSLFKLYGSPNYSFTNYNTTLNDNLFIIGIIEIPSLKIHYPILSNCSEESLRIAPCRFAGPMPNNIGNLCIAGHNYADNSFFAKIIYLRINQIIRVYNLDGKFIDYIVYECKTVFKNDLSVALQNTNGSKQITLITCSSLESYRFIVRAKE